MANFLRVNDKNMVNLSLVYRITKDLPELALHFHIIGGNKDRRPIILTLNFDTQEELISIYNRITETVGVLDVSKEDSNYETV